MNLSKTEKIEERRNLAHELATKCANHPRNQANPFAYARAHMLVMQGILGRDDFVKTDFHPADVG